MEVVRVSGVTSLLVIRHQEDQHHEVNQGGLIWSYLLVGRRVFEYERDVLRICQ